MGLAYHGLRWPALACAELRIRAILGHFNLGTQLHDLRHSYAILGMAYHGLRWRALKYADLRIRAILGHSNLGRQLHDLRDSCALSPRFRPSRPVRSWSLSAASGKDRETGLATELATGGGSLRDSPRSPLRESGMEDCGAPWGSKVSIARPCTPGRSAAPLPPTDEWQPGPETGDQPGGSDTGRPGRRSAAMLSAIRSADCCTESGARCA